MTSNGEAPPARLLLRIDEVSELTGVPVPSLRWMRKHGMGPRSGTLGRKVVYRPEDVMRWIDTAFEDSAETEGEARSDADS